MMSKQNDAGFNRYLYLFIYLFTLIVFIYTIFSRSFGWGINNCIEIRVEYSQSILGAKMETITIFHLTIFNVLQYIV